MAPIVGDGVVDAELAAAQEMHCLSQAERLLDGAKLLLRSLAVRPIGEDGSDDSGEHLARTVFTIIDQGARP